MATDGGMSHVGLRSKPGSHAKTGTEHLFRSIHPYDFTALLSGSCVCCSQLAADIINSNLPPVLRCCIPGNIHKAPSVLRAWLLTICGDDVSSFIYQRSWLAKLLGHLPSTSTAADENYCYYYYGYCYYCNH